MVKHLHARALLLFVLASSLACQPLAGPVVVEAVLRNEATNEIELSTEVLETPTDLWLGEGSLFTVRRDVSINKLTLSGVEDTSTYPQVLDYVDEKRAESGGRPPDMVMHSEGDTWIADDYDTLFVLSTWIGLERSLLYFREAGDDSGATTRDLLVAQYGKLHFMGIPEGGADNAAYLDRTDTMILDPVFLIGQTTAMTSDAIPLALSDGVIAHELGHRLFFYRVFVDVAEDAFRLEASADVDAGTANLIRGLNEGVADAMAIGMTRDPYFGRFVALGDDRDVEADFARAITYDLLRDGVDDEGCGDSEANFAATNFNPYCIATVFARTLWEASGEDGDIFHDVIGPALVRALPRFGSGIDDDTAANGTFTVLPERLLEPLVDELSGSPSRDLLCDALAFRFASVHAAGRIPSCP
jgi:hypothetical protein